MTFWDWFVRPFAEILAGIVITAGLIALAFLVVIAQDACATLKRWSKRRKAP